MQFPVFLEVVHTVLPHKLLFQEEDGEPLLPEQVHEEMKLLVQLMVFLLTVVTPLA